MTPIDAYRMATLNPATYYGLDGDLGGIAPGRYADICVLDDLAEPRPRAVLARGGDRRARDGPRERRGAALAAGLPIASGAARGALARSARRLRASGAPRYSVIQLVSAVISRLQERPWSPAISAQRFSIAPGAGSRRVLWRASPTGSTGSRRRPAPTSIFSLWVAGPKRWRVPSIGAQGARGHRARGRRRAWA